jgi:hypothetical protein
LDAIIQNNLTPKWISNIANAMKQKFVILLKDFVIYRHGDASLVSRDWPALPIFGQNYKL